MGKRRSRSREKSIDRKELSNNGAERSKSRDDKKIDDVPEVVIVKSPRKRMSAFSRYAKEKQSTEEEENSQSDHQHKSSPSPQPKKRKTGKEKHQRESVGEEEETSANSPRRAKRKKKKEQEDDSEESGDSESEVKTEVTVSNTSEGEDGVGEDTASSSEQLTASRDTRENRSECEGREYHERGAHHERQSHHRQDRDGRPRDGRPRDERPYDRRWDREPRHHSHDKHRGKHDEPQQKPPEFRCFPSSTGVEVVLVMQRPEKLSLWGCCGVRSLHGNVELCGYVLRPGAQPVDIFSPNSTSFVTISTMRLSNTTPDPPVKQSLKELPGFDEKIKEEICAAVVDADSVVLVFGETGDTQRLDFVTGVAGFKQLFWTKENSKSVKGRFSQLGSLLVAVALDAGVKQTRVSDDMKNAAQQFCASIQKGETSSIAVCGGQNVGKSTMCRYLTNSALNKCRQVAYLECDVGQTEFSPPGCVSLSLVSTPVLGPPFTHQKQPHRMVYFGAVSPADDPAHYLSCVKFAFAAFSSLEQPCPLVVNTMGWNQGLGLMLLASTMSFTRPRYVVQFESTSQNRNLRPVTPQFVMEQQRWPTMRLDAEEEGSPSHSLLMVPSLVDFGEFRSKYHPADHRMLSLLGYLSRYQSQTGPCVPLNTLTPQTVPWCRMAVHVTHTAVPNTQILYALNGGIVGLCHVPTDAIVSPDDESLPRFLSEKPVCECLGFGIVRAIDPEKKVFHIISDVKLDAELKVNCLLLGSLDVPHKLIASQPGVDDEIPYYGGSKDVLGATAIRRRRHLARKGRGGDQNKT